MQAPLGRQLKHNGKDWLGSCTQRRRNWGSIGAIIDAWATQILLLVDTPLSSLECYITVIHLEALRSAELVADYELDKRTFILERATDLVSS